MNELKLCHCGKPLHYMNLNTFIKISQLSNDLGEFIKIKSTQSGKTYLVQRHYIALHGINGEDLDNLGFELVSE